MSAPRATDGYRARSGGPWTREKLTYLRKYAHGFMTAMAPKRTEGRWSRLVFIDLLCGPGKDIIDDGGEEDGSPLVALKTVPKFDCLFLGDKSPSNVGALRHRIPYEEMSRVELKSGDCHVRAQQVIADIETWGTLGFAFVDPQAFEVRFELFETLAKRPIDILFLFPSGIGIKRNIEQFAQTEQCKMDSLWGNRDWRQLSEVRRVAGESLTESDAERLDQSWVQVFRERVATLGYPHPRCGTSASHEDQDTDVSLVVLL